MSASCPNGCGHEVEAPQQKRGFRPFRAIFQVVLVYLILVFGGGTLQNTGHPVAVEAGKLIHTVTLVDPAIRWADRRGLDPLAMGLHIVSGGFPV